MPHCCVSTLRDLSSGVKLCWRTCRKVLPAPGLCLLTRAGVRGGSCRVSREHAASRLFPPAQPRRSPFQKGCSLWSCRPSTMVTISSWHSRSLVLAPWEKPLGSLLRLILVCAPWSWCGKSLCCGSSNCRMLSYEKTCSEAAGGFRCSRGAALWSRRSSLLQCSLFSSCFLLSWNLAFSLPFTVL